MAAFRGPKVWLWRWRRNPLRRRSDVLEAWIMLAAWVFTVLAGTGAGLVAARTVEHGLARQRTQWHAVPARLTEDAPVSGATESGVGVVWAKVGWSAPDGTARSGQVRVYAGTPVGTPVMVWTDPEGRPVTRPTGVAEARVRALLVGTLVGGGVAGVPLAVGWLLRRRLDGLRMDQWDEEWERFGPMWRWTTS
jgi:hypothetical protein